jgi:DNA-binding MarR family transcriptional regulator
MAVRATPRHIGVADALHSAAIRLLRRLRREDERSGLSAAKLSALSVLVFGGPMRLTDLARAEQVKPPTMTRLAAAMESEGLVRRRADAADARAVRLEATAKGHRMLQEGRRRRVERLGAAIGELPDDEVDLLQRAAAVIARLHLAP